MKQIEGYRADAVKASAESAELAKKIADKREKRNVAVMHLQKDQKKRDKAMKEMQQSYERRVKELQVHAVSNISLPNGIDENSLPEYDVFVSHEWEDKEDFVDEFVEALTALEVRVWYDKNQIKWGDSMRERIDDGLKKSRFGVAVLSPNYIAENKYWTKAELDGLFQLESVNGKTLLPIWHNLTKQQVMNYSPIIANKLAMTTASMTAQEIAAEILKLTPKE